MSQVDRLKLSRRVVSPGLAPRRLQQAPRQSGSTQAQTDRRHSCSFTADGAAAGVGAGCLIGSKSRDTRSSTPTLTGLGERSHLLAQGINLATHTTDVVNVVKFERLANIVLVGHSLRRHDDHAGRRTDRADDSSIVFLDAFLPEVGEVASTTASQTSRDAIAAAIQRGEFRPSRFRRRCSATTKDRPWIDSMSTPHPILTLTDKCVSTTGREKIAKKTYIRA